MKLNDIVVWATVSFVVGAMVILMYPFYLLRNIGFHLRAPSVLLYSLAVFGIDRVTKFVIQISTGSLPVPVISDFFTLTFVKNPGVAFGWFPDWRLPPILMAMVMITIISYYSFQLSPREKLTRWALALLVGGAIGNLYDRVAYGYVVDFFLFHFGSIDFPVFNVADVAIDVGVLLLFVDIFFLGNDEEQQPQATPVAA